jgi:multiple sugar transport system permease protein
MNHKNLKKLITYFYALLVVLFVVTPLIWALLSSLKPSNEILKYPPTLLPTKIVFDHYINLIKRTNFLQYFLNSLIVGIISTFITLLIATPAAYSLTRFNYRGRNVISALLLFSYMVPLLLLGLPLSVIMTKLNLINTRVSLVIAYVAFSLPFSMWMLRAFFSSVPKSLEEAAMIDGASFLQTLTKIVLPLVKPGLISSGIFIFILVWNEYTLALIFINSESLKTLPVGIAAFMGMTAYQWGNILTSIVLMSFPVIIIFMFVQKAMVRGFILGATKE